MIESCIVVMSLIPGNALIELFPQLGETEVSYLTHVLRVIHFFSTFSDALNLISVADMVCTSGLAISFKFDLALVL